MYTEESTEYNNNYGDNYENSYDENNGEKSGFPYKSLLIKILIIFVVLLLIIWIIAKLTGGSKVPNDGKVFNNNLDTIRLASEKYFFIDKNLPKETNEKKTITLKEMNDQNLVEIIYDYKNKACSTDSSESVVSLTKTSIAYEMMIKLTCTEETKEVIYYYDLQNGKCLSCSGETNMDGTLVLNDDKEDDNINNDDDNVDDNNLDDDNIDEEFEISCDNWSIWTTKKLDDSSLDVKERTLIKGYKNTEAGVDVTYGEWSEYSTNPITPSDTLEVETKIDGEKTWSEVKTTSSYVSDSDTRKVVDVSTSGGNTTCKNVTTNVRGKLSLSTYTSYNAKGLIVTLHKVYNENYALVYDATYKTTKKECSTSSTKTTYSYQDLVSSEVTQYRSRTITKITIPGKTEYTDYVETLPSGYTKIEGSELVQYAYKDKVCK